MHSATHSQFTQNEKSIMAQVRPARNARRVLSASTLKGDKVINLQGEDLGKIEDLMLDLERGLVPRLPRDGR